MSHLRGHRQYKGDWSEPSSEDLSWLWTGSGDPRLRAMRLPNPRMGAHLPLLAELKSGIRRLLMLGTRRV